MFIFIADSFARLLIRDLCTQKTYEVFKNLFPSKLPGLGLQVFFLKRKKRLKGAFPSNQFWTLQALLMNYWG